MMIVEEEEQVRKAGVGVCAVPGIGRTIASRPGSHHIDACLLLVQLYINQGKTEQARTILRKVLSREGLDKEVRLSIEKMLKALIEKEEGK